MPASPSSPHPSALGRHIARLVDYAAHYSVELILVALILYVCISRGLAVEIDIHDPNPPVATPEAAAAVSMGGWFSQLRQRAVASLVAVEERATIETLDDFTSVAVTDDPAPHISNLTLVLSPDYGTRKGLAPRIIAAKKQRVRSYIDRYAAAAQREQRDYGILASITLAQGLLESNAGDSKLAVNSNNHFGIKCRSKCLGCTCRNYGDDTRYDMFRVFATVGDSFREHSLLLNTPRYAKLRTHGTDYRKWAHGLRACGYATDKKYADKLIKIIEELRLDRYDRTV